MATYIFTVRGEREIERHEKKWGREVVAERLAARLWPLNRLTPHQKTLAAGDRALFYIAGSYDRDGHHIIATAEIAGERQQSSRRDSSMPSWIGSGAPLYDVPLRNVEWFDPPIRLNLHYRRRCRGVPDVRVVHNPNSHAEFRTGSRHRHEGKLIFTVHDLGQPKHWLI